jgi:hypothetical protein
MNKWTNNRTNKWTDDKIDEQTNDQMDKQMNRWTNEEKNVWTNKQMYEQKRYLGKLTGKELINHHPSLDSVQWTDPHTT